MASPHHQGHSQGSSPACAPLPHRLHEPACAEGAGRWPLTEQFMACTWGVGMGEERRQETRNTELERPRPRGGARSCSPRPLQQQTWWPPRLWVLLCGADPTRWPGPASSHPPGPRGTPGLLMPGPHSAHSVLLVSRQGPHVLVAPILAVTVRASSQPKARATSSE
jgi:hypothetical protein